MTKLSQASGTRRSRRGAGGLRATTGWVGWIYFAATMLIILGLFQAIQGLIALFDDEFYVVGPNGLAVNVDLTAWGWTLLIIGLLAFGTGLGLLTGNIVARVLGVAFAMLSAIVNLMFIAAFPLWGAIVITIDVIVIYAIVAHGDDVKD